MSEKKTQKYFHPITKLPRYRASTEEPAPTKGNQVVLDAVIQDFRDKAIAGTEKYGTLLETFNGRDAANDAYQEIIDLVMYLKQLQLEWGLLREILKEYLIAEELWRKGNGSKATMTYLKHDLRKLMGLEDVP